MPSPGGRSALIVEIPAAEAAVGPYREQLDASAPLGVPAHITVLAPFLPAEAIDRPVLARLEHLVAAVRRFRVELDRTDWFGDEVLWLAPRDPRPFRALTSRIYQAFPACPPFGGQFDEVIPHLTVGHGHPVSELRAAEQAIRACLPISGQASAVTLVIQQPATTPWTTAGFSLA